MSKTGRNKMCFCGSGKKYKKCCLTTHIEDEISLSDMVDNPLIYRTGGPLDTDRLKRVNQYLLDRYQRRALNMSEIMTINTVKAINTANANRDLVVVAERNDNTEAVFQKHGDENSDILFLYRNQFLCFNYEQEWDIAIKRFNEYIHHPRTKSQRLHTVNETKLKLIEHELENDPASKILWKLMDDYVNNGHPYVGVELKMKGRTLCDRKYVINLYNDLQCKDAVVIRKIKDDEDNMPQSMSPAVMNDTEETSDSDSDSAPELVGHLDPYD